MCVSLAGEAPRAEKGLENVRVEAGEKATLSCEMSSGRPAGEIHWYRSGRCCKIFREIFDDDKYEIKRDDKTMSLVIGVTERTDSATYRCEAVNKFGKVRSECRLVVVQRTLLIVVNSLMTIIVCNNDSPVRPHNNKCFLYHN